MILFPAISLLFRAAGPGQPGSAAGRTVGRESIFRKLLQTENKQRKHTHSSVYRVVPAAKSVFSQATMIKFFMLLIH